MSYNCVSLAKRDDTETKETKNQGRAYAVLKNLRECLTQLPTSCARISCTAMSVPARTYPWNRHRLLWKNQQGLEQVKKRIYKIVNAACNKISCKKLVHNKVRTLRALSPCFPPPLLLSYLIEVETLQTSTPFLGKVSPSVSLFIFFIHIIYIFSHIN